MKEKLLENKKKVLENLYLTVFAVFCLYFFMWTTTFWVSWPDFFVSDLRTIMIALIVVKASVSEKKSNWKELVFEIGLIVVFLAVKNRNGQEILLDTLLLILGAKEIASEKLIRVYTVTIATALFVTIGASLLGIIENLSYAQPGRMTRMAFGIGYPTDFGAHVLLLYSAILFEKKKIQYVELVITVLIGGLIYIFCGARTNALCIWLLAGVLFYTKIRETMQKKWKKEYEMASWFSGLLASAGTICAAGILILSMLYTKGSSIFLEVGLNLESAAFFFPKRDGGLWIFNIRTVYSHAGQWRKYRDTIELLFPGQFLYFHFAAVWSDHVRDDSHFVGDHRIESKKRKRLGAFVDSCDHCISEYYGTAFAGYFI